MQTESEEIVVNRSSITYRSVDSLVILFFYFFKFF